MWRSVVFLSFIFSYSLSRPLDENKNLPENVLVTENFVRYNGSATTTHLCPEKYFYCIDMNECLSDEFICNDVIDCPNGQDEADIFCLYFKKDNPNKNLNDLTNLLKTAIARINSVIDQVNYINKNYNAHNINNSLEVIKIKENLFNKTRINNNTENASKNLSIAQNEQQKRFDWKKKFKEATGTDFNDKINNQNRPSSVSVSKEAPYSNSNNNSYQHNGTGWIFVNFGNIFSGNSNVNGNGNDLGNGNGNGVNYKIP